MTINAWQIPLQKTAQIPKEVKRVKILSGKYKGKVRDFCHFIGEDKIVVHVDVCKNVTYNTASVEFVDSDYILVSEYY